MKSKKILLSALLTLGLAGTAVAQNTVVNGQTKNYIATGMPILLIAPDAISAGMGDAGVASTPDIYSAHWNNAKFAFIEGDFGFSTTYTPWLRNLGVGDMNLLYLGGYKRINNMSAVAASLTYFSLGEIQGTDIEGHNTHLMNPNEFAVDASYALKINEEFSLGASARFIRSDLTNGQIINDGDGSYVTTKPAWSLAADLGLYWEKELAANQEVALGAFFSNLGAKLSYSDDDTKKDFLP
ncbi:MAG: PorV/PorQ family protein, partial [Bacteroidales bacterium]|nr:PorV/PorQ family protein [Bacteroidales bacterium]